LAEIRKFPMLKPEQEFVYAKRWREHRDSDAAYQLVTSHLRLVAKIAMRYRGYGLPIAEIVSEGNVDLMQAVKRFDPDRGSALPPMRCGGSGPPSRSTSCDPVGREDRGQRRHHRQGIRAARWRPRWWGASKTNELAGDGTTATVLAKAIVKEGTKSIAVGMNPMDLKRGIDLAVEAIVSGLLDG
jgi:hypothetical protein